MITRLLGLFLVLSATGCGGTLYQPGRAWRIDPHPEAEIDEADIRAALQARPQIPQRARVAFFNLAPERDEAIEEMLGAVPGVQGTYRIPTVLVTGQRRYDDTQSPYADRQVVSMKSLRLIAARAHCDLVVVFDYGYKIERTVNGWAALNILILPALFTPQVDSEIESYVDAYVIDVRNGYLYGQASDTTRSEASSLTIWSDAEERHVEQQWTRLIEATREHIERVLAEPEDQMPAPEPPSPDAAVPADGATEPAPPSAPPG